MHEDNIPTPTGLDIYWEPWVDAYNNDATEELHNQLQNEDDEYLPFEMGDGDIREFSRPIKTIMTPFGIMPLTEQSLASNHFKFWVGHSNFKLLDSYYKIIDGCRGVETVDILTPYRFRIAVGKLFQDRDVMDTVRITLLKVAKQHESKEQR